MNKLTDEQIEKAIRDHLVITNEPGMKYAVAKIQALIEGSKPKSRLYNHVINTFKKKTQRKWDTLYWAVDIHDTIVLANYKANDIPTEFFPNAKEALLKIGARKDCCLILYTCSHPHEIEEYLKFFASHGINFKHVNENPEAENTAFGYFQDKFYFNFMLDDKGGFNPTKDWPAIMEALDQVDKDEN